MSSALMDRFPLLSLQVSKGERREFRGWQCVCLGGGDLRNCGIPSPQASVGRQREAKTMEANPHVSHGVCQAHVAFAGSQDCRVWAGLQQGSDFHILPIATPKSLIVWPQSKYFETTPLQARERARESERDFFVSFQLWTCMFKLGQDQATVSCVQCL